MAGKGDAGAIADGVAGVIGNGEVSSQTIVYSPGDLARLANHSGTNTDTTKDPSDKCGNPPEATVRFSVEENQWAPQQRGIGGGTSRGPSLAVFQNKLFAAWKGAGDDSRMFWSSFDGINPWTIQQPGIGGGTSVGPSLAVFQNRLFAAWKGVGSDQRMFWSSFATQ